MTSLKMLIEAAQTTRQAFHKWKQTSAFEHTRSTPLQVVTLAREVRKDFLPGSSARVVYSYIRKKLPEKSKLLIGCGKHQFEQICLANGLRIEFRRFIPKTTIKGGFIFPNRVNGLIINEINKVWVSDLSYIFNVDGKLVGYSTSIIDLYSKHLLGLHFSKTMQATCTTQVVLENALKVRGIERYDSLIFHSDGGKQFIEKKFTSTLCDYNIVSSMAQSCYENASAEAFNDTLKNHLLIDFDINSFCQLKKIEQHIVHCYNHNKPHSSLNGLTPIEHEAYISKIPSYQRTPLKIYSPDQPKNNSTMAVETLNG
jgi:putative transposase